MKLSIMKLSAHHQAKRTQHISIQAYKAQQKTTKANRTQHKRLSSETQQNIILLLFCAIMLSFVMLSVSMFSLILQNAVVPSLNMLSVIMLNVILLKVIMPSVSLC